jgi:hypothetical protein
LDRASPQFDLRREEKIVLFSIYCVCDAATSGFYDESMNALLGNCEKLCSSHFEARKSFSAWVPNCKKFYSSFPRLYSYLLGIFIDEN